MAMEWESRVSRVMKDRASLRAVIPEPVARALELKHDDVVTWSMEPKGSSMVVRVRRKGGSSSSHPSSGIS
ncbi:MAG: hypothetical protein KGI98_03140 [Euryarchaeota archaeon]|nr:hypothetical protein [Euryarchaeota archaeon]